MYPYHFALVRGSRQTDAMNMRVYVHDTMKRGIEAPQRTTMAVVMEVIEQKTTAHSCQAMRMAHFRLKSLWSGSHETMGSEWFSNVVMCLKPLK